MHRHHTISERVLSFVYHHKIILFATNACPNQRRRHGMGNNFAAALSVGRPWARNHLRSFRSSSSPRKRPSLLCIKAENELAYFSQEVWVLKKKIKKYNFFCRNLTWWENFVRPNERKEILKPKFSQILIELIEFKC